MNPKPAALKRHLSACLLLSSNLLAVPASAHLPELYGREYLRVDPHTFKPPKNPDRKRVLTLSGKEERKYEAQLRALEVAGGPYSPALADPLVNLSRYQLGRGDIEDAIDSLRRAIQLVRINDGLYSHNQLPLLRQLIELHRDEGDYVRLGEAYSYYYRVRLAGKGPVTGDDLATALEYLDWERELYASRPGSEARAHLLRSYEANRSMLEAVGTGDTQVHIALAMSQVRNLYLILGDKPPEMLMPSFSGDIPRDEKRLSALQRTAYGTARKLLQSCIDQSQGASPGKLAEIHLELGDWEHWNGYLRRARGQYARVIELMQQADEEEQLARWFDEPVELPDKRELWPLIQEQNGNVPRLIEASFEVNRKGEPRRVEVTVEDEDDAWQAGRIRAMLRDSHFRPRIGSNGPESGPRVTRYYRLVGIR